jgi:hypothetical protein
MWTGSPCPELMMEARAGDEALRSTLEWRLADTVYPCVVLRNCCGWPGTLRRSVGAMEGRLSSPTADPLVLIGRAGPPDPPPKLKPCTASEVKMEASVSPKTNRSILRIVFNLETNRSMLRMVSP